MRRRAVIVTAALIPLVLPHPAAALAAAVPVSAPPVSAAPAPAAGFAAAPGSAAGFGDTALGEEDPASGAYRPGWHLISNTILVQRGDALGATTWGAAVPDAADGDRYWTQGMVQVGNLLNVLCQRVRNTTDFFQLRVADPAQAAPILSAQISSVRLIGGRWVLAYKPWNGWGDTVYVETRATPWGSPTGTVTVSSPAGANYQTYSPQLHPEQTLSSGKLLLSIAWNGKTLADVGADADLYKPRFYEITMP